MQQRVPVPLAHGSPVLLLSPAGRAPKSSAAGGGGAIRGVASRARRRADVAKFIFGVFES